MGEGERRKINLSLARKASQGYNELPSVVENGGGGDARETEPLSLHVLGSSRAVPSVGQTARPPGASITQGEWEPEKGFWLLSRCKALLNVPLDLVEGSRGATRMRREMADNNNYYVFSCTCAQAFPHSHTHTHRMVAPGMGIIDV